MKKPHTTADNLQYREMVYKNKSSIFTCNLQDVSDNSI
jgi:hypothetical protein